MSLELNAIRKRLDDLKQFQGTAVQAQNTTEFYLTDVADLLKVVDVLSRSLARQVQWKMKKECGKAESFEVYLASVNASISALLRDRIVAKGQPHLDVVKP